MKINLFSPITFKAISINQANKRNESENINAINDTKRKISGYATKTNCQKNSAERFHIEKQIEEEKQKSLKPWYKIFWEKRIINDYIRQETVEKDKINKSQNIELSAAKENTVIINKLLEDLKTSIKANDKARAMRNSSNNTFITGKYRADKGFSQIAGYRQEKEILYKYFISEIAKEKAGEKANIPSSILFFGPKGNGKTTFATAFAQEIGCENPISVKTYGADMYSKQQNFYKKLNIAANKARRQYDQTGDIQVILVDEFDQLANKNSSVLPELKEFLKTCYEKYHCIVFATTNYPLSLGFKLNDDSKLFPYIISQDPPSKRNKAEILKYYLKDKLENEPSDQDIEALIQLIEEQESINNGRYSISQIRNNICKANNDDLLDIERVKENIEKSKPSIKDGQLQTYEEAMEIIMKNQVEE